MLEWYGFLGGTPAGSAVHIAVLSALLKSGCTEKCAIEARLRSLQECNTTGIDVVKAAAYLTPKGDRGQEHAVRKATRGKYLSRVGQLGHLW